MKNKRKYSAGYLNKISLTFDVGDRDLELFNVNIMVKYLPFSLLVTGIKIIK